MEADFGPEAGNSIKLAQLALMLAVICASPLAILPAKQSWFSLAADLCPSTGRRRNLNRSQDESEALNEVSDTRNILVTFIMVFGCYLTAICIANIGSVISIAGTTCNPFIGFLFPIIFYLRLETIEHQKL